MNARLEPITLGWSASLQLSFERRQDRTVLARNRHVGPLRVQRPFYPESAGQCHVYILHPPGGVVAGDSLAIQVNVASEAHGLMTTPSAGRVYRTNEQQLTQTQSVNITIENGGFGEWLPQENIVFDRAHAVNRTRLNLAENAQFNSWEITCLGRPASQDDFLQGKLLQRLEVYREDIPLLLERNRFQGGDALLKKTWGLNGATAFGTFVSSCRDEESVRLLRELCARFCGQTGESLAAVTVLPELLVVRALASQGGAVKQLFIEAWRLVRRAQLGIAPVAPRIWFT